MKTSFAALVALAISTLVGCQSTPTAPPHESPTVTFVSATDHAITVKVTAGPSGAPAGFSVQWQTLEDFQAFGWDNTRYRYCGAWFSGNPAQSTFNLDPNESVTVTIGVVDYSETGATGGCGMLPCGTSYVVRAIAHASSVGNSSTWSTPVGTDGGIATSSCAPPPCNKILTYNQWKAAATWPDPYTRTKKWFNTSSTWGDMATPRHMDNPAILAQVYITVTLNIANGAVAPQSLLQDVARATSYFEGITALNDSQIRALHSHMQGLLGELTCE